MHGKKLVVLALLISNILACNGKDSSQAPKSCMESMPDSIVGMSVTGARSPENVTHNLWPIVCLARDLYQKQRKDNPNLKGLVEIKMAVEFNGEIGSYAITRSTLNSPAFENKIKRLFQFMDFDPYGEHNTESEIVLPIHFK